MLDKFMEFKQTVAEVEAENSKPMLNDGLECSADGNCKHCDRGWCKSIGRYFNRQHCKHYLADTNEAGGYLDEGGCELAL